MGVIGNNINSLRIDHGMTNYLINGNFDVWQYATSQTSSGYGSDDRWTNLNLNSTKTHSQAACTDTERAFFNAMYFSRTSVTSVPGADNYVRKSQRIEDVNKLAGKTVTLTFWVKADANKNIAVEFVQNFGTGGTPSAEVQSLGSTVLSVTSSWQKKSVTVNMPSIVGKTLGSDGVISTYTGVNFWFDAGSNLNTRTASLGQQSGTFDIAQVQVEDGAVSTPYEQRPYGLELSLCQRYLPKVYSTTGNVSIGTCMNQTTTTAISQVFFQVSTRVPPTGMIFSGNAISIQSNNAFALSSLTFRDATNNSAAINSSIATTTAGLAGVLQLQNVSYIYFTGCEL